MKHKVLSIAFSTLVACVACNKTTPAPQGGYTYLEPFIDWGTEQSVVMSHIENLDGFTLNESESKIGEKLVYYNKIGTKITAEFEKDLCLTEYDITYMNAYDNLADLENDIARNFTIKPWEKNEISGITFYTSKITDKDCNLTITRYQDSRYGASTLSISYSATIDWKMKHLIR